MKYVVWRGIVLFLGFVFLNSCAQQAPPEIKWASSLEDAFSLAIEKDQPVVAEFWSDG